MTPIEKPYTIAELRKMQEEQGHVSAIVSWPWDETGDIEALNDRSSELITGSECGLEDISYTLVGCNTETQEVYIEVTGSVENFLKEETVDHIRVEYDLTYTGGDYSKVGDFAYIPCWLIDRHDGSVEKAFEQWTKHSSVHIIHYSEDELYDENGRLIES